MRVAAWFLVPIILVTLTACPIATPKNNPDGSAKTPACASGCHDPKALNPPHSPQPKDKQIKVRFDVLVGLPKRPVNIMLQIGGAVYYYDDVREQAWRNPDTLYASPGTTVAIEVVNPVVGGGGTEYTVAGYILCVITVGNKFPYREVDRMELYGTGKCSASGKVRATDG